MKIQKMLFFLGGGGRVEGSGRGSFRGGGGGGQGGCERG